MFDDIEEIFQKWRSFGNYPKALVTIFTLIGTSIILVWSLKLICNLYRGVRLYIISQLCCQVDYRGRYGQWVVISGATDGIGLSMAKEFARRGHSLVIIGRNEEKLARTKMSLEEEANVGEVVTVKIDLSDSNISNYERIVEEIDPYGRDIGILINNAGTFPTEGVRFNSVDIDYLRTITNVNVLGTVFLTRLIMPSMLDRGKGLLVNVSSLTGVWQIPYTSTYASTKAFINSFSHTLRMEYASHPIDIINLAPGPVQTKLFKVASDLEKPTLFSPSSDDYARSSINALSTRIPVISGTVLHGLMVKLGAITVSLGLVPIMMKLFQLSRPSYYNLSPVMMRKSTKRSSSPGNTRSRA